MSTFRSPSRLAALASAAALTLVPALMAAAPTTAQATPAAGPAARVTAKYTATITRTEHGIPHITANGWGSLGFGSGYATAGTSICDLADVLITARGDRSRYLGPNRRYSDHVSMMGTNLQADVLARDLRARRVVEKLLASKAGPGAKARAMVRGYAVGVNTWLAKNRTRITDPACKGKPWLRTKATTLDMWYGIYLANILASTGHFLPQIVGATPPAPTDVPTLPVSARFAPAPRQMPNRDALLKGLGKDPASPFGSNATAVGRTDTTTRRGMVLGNPHFPWVGRYRFTQQHLTIPGVYNVAGASLMGSPVVNIGWNKQVAWSHTVSTAYRFTPYEYRLVGSPTSYLSTDGGIRNLERRVVKVPVKRADGSIGTASEDLYRTPEGYVISDPSALMEWTPVSVFAVRDANAEQLRTIDTFLEMGAATGVRDLIARQDAGGGMPWVNTTAADRAGNVVYADHSVVPNVSNTLANRCMTPVGRVLQQVAGLPGLDGTRARADCAWGTDADAQRPGIFGPGNLPVTYRTDWVINANDSYWLPNPRQKLTGFARIIGCEACVRTLRSRVVYRYVDSWVKAGHKVSPRHLASTQHRNRVYGAEVMSANGDLDKVCRAAGGTAACTALRAWDRTSNTSSRGNHIFEEFVKRLPSPGLVPGPSIWKVPFDQNDPLHTPRDLDETNSDVIAAMKGALDHLAARKIPWTATWGSLQVAGDRGAPAIPIGGGLGDEAGNANAIASREPASNKDRFKPVSYGSSHIQAIAFLDRGRISARTILTYGQSDNPRSRWSSDQTRLFSAQKWVSFPWTSAQIRAQRVSKVKVSGR